MRKLGIPRLRGGSSDSDPSSDNDNHLIDQFGEEEAPPPQAVEEISQHGEIDRRFEKLLRRERRISLLKVHTVVAK